MRAAAVGIVEGTLVEFWAETVGAGAVEVILTSCAAIEGVAVLVTVTVVVKVAVAVALEGSSIPSTLATFGALGTNTSVTF